jgi:hypothetical protein
LWTQLPPSQWYAGGQERAELLRLLVRLGPVRMRQPVSDAAVANTIRYEVSFFMQ